MWSLLLDQHISAEIAAQIRAKRPEIPILGLSEWREGAFVGIADLLILHAAAEEGLTLVTYDRKSTLRFWSSGEHRGFRTGGWSS